MQLYKINTFYFSNFHGVISQMVALCLIPYQYPSLAPRPCHPSSKLFHSIIWPPNCHVKMATWLIKLFMNKKWLEYVFLYSIGMDLFRSCLLSSCVFSSNKSVDDHSTVHPFGILYRPLNE